MSKWIVTKEEKYLNEWNAFVLKSQDGSFLQTLGRVASYRKYGFDHELLICVDDDGAILGGSLNLIVKFLFFKLYICSFGPISSKDPLLDIDAYLGKFLSRAQELGAMASQLTLPAERNFGRVEGIQIGKIFEKIPVYETNNRIKLLNEYGEKLDSESVLESFSKKARRDVRASYRKGLYSKVSQGRSCVKEAYACIEQNARNKGYGVRGWNEFSDALLMMTDSGCAFLLSAWYEGEIQGAVLLERSNNTLHYTMGGVLRHSPDLNTGYFLQMEALKLAIEQGFDFYDISSGGPSEVKKFKTSFNPDLVVVGKTFNIVFKPVMYKVFNYLYTKVSPSLTSILRVARGSLK